MSEATATRRNTLPLVLVSTVAGLLIASTLLLWAHYGTTVFFEMIRAGFIACFG